MCGSSRFKGQASHRRLPKDCPHLWPARAATGFSLFRPRVTGPCADTSPQPPQPNTATTATAGLQQHGNLTATTSSSTTSTTASATTTGRNNTRTTANTTTTPDRRTHTSTTTNTAVPTSCQRSHNHIGRTRPHDRTLTRHGQMKPTRPHRPITAYHTTTRATTTF